MTKITQADVDAAANNAVFVEIRDLILARKVDHHVEPWAAHRELGREQAEREVEWLK